MISLLDVLEHYNENHDYELILQADGTRLCIINRAGNTLFVNTEVDKVIEFLLKLDKE